MSSFHSFYDPHGWVLNVDIVVPHLPPQVRDKVFDFLAAGFIEEDCVQACTPQNRFCISLRSIFLHVASVTAYSITCDSDVSKNVSLAVSKVRRPNNLRAFGVGARK